MLIYLAKKYLPWVNIGNTIKKDIILQLMKICEKKLSVTPEELCSGIPLEFVDYIKYCRNLEFEDEPNYNYLKGLFTDILKRNEQIIDERFLRFIEFSILSKKKSPEKVNYNQKSTSNPKYNELKKEKIVFIKDFINK